ncbi:MAG: 23S rRNA (guanosine(2251)-2'-O)-methyltransferase RlmB [Rhodospirillaceae bacterium]|nr:23S rRNA (guanosine(2251)-2'-O)-methyltransferase RlmB [Rhodospirillaceae bacterium]MBB56473.1 23S rRNA (guanosine(2251)-2'-O)-methyltransferase RlmB [Rhodospirillaceae bacterium]|tara:strand:+ start:227 stop:1126 length:900 start_codon:yes stop_codon:yes gene_type:complete
MSQDMTKHTRSKGPARDARKTGHSNTMARRESGPDRTPVGPKVNRSKEDRKGSPKAAGGNRYWLTGTHPVLAALANPERRINRLLATKNALETVLAAAEQRDITPELVERSEIERLTGPDEVHQGLAIDVFPLEPLALTDLPDAQQGHPILILDQVTDPRNVGAILRSAAVFGAVAVVVQDRHAPPETAVLAKAASGALETTPLVRVGNLARAMADIKQLGYWTVGLSGAAQETLSALPTDRPIALVLGAEGDGMRRLTEEACDKILKIAMRPNAVGSLNVSNAAAVALFAAVNSQTPQ